MPFCTNCGAKLPEGSNVCSSCGTVATPLDPQPQYQEPQYRNPDPSRDQNQYQDPYQNPYRDPYQNQYRDPYADRSGGFRANIRKRELVLPIILCFVTCGIYGLVWFYNLVSDLNTAVPESTDKDPGTVLILSIITCGIYGLIWLYGAGEKVDRIRQMNGESASNSGLIYLLLTLFGLGIVAYALIQTELNKIAADA